MTKEALYHYLQSQHLAVVSSVSPSGMPQSAVLGIAVSSQLELIFDTVSSSRKYANLIANPNVAVVVGWDNETTVQLEGTASLLPAGEPHPLKDIYFKTFHDAKQRAYTWPDLVHFMITPRWIRYSNFNELNEPVQEWDLK